MAGSEFTVTATVNISELVAVQTLRLTWLDSSGNERNTTLLAMDSSGSGSKQNIISGDSSGYEQSGTTETTAGGMSAFSPSGPFVSTLDLVFNNLLLSQVGLYTFLATITETSLNTITLERTYQITAQSKYSFFIYLVNFGSSMP